MSRVHRNIHKKPKNKEQREEDVFNLLSSNFSKKRERFSSNLDPSDPLLQDDVFGDAPTTAYFLQKLDHEDFVAPASSFFHAVLCWDGRNGLESPKFACEAADSFKASLLDALLWCCFGTTRTRAGELLRELETAFYEALEAEDGNLFSVRKVQKGWMHDACVHQLRNEPYPLWCPAIEPLGATKSRSAGTVTRKTEETPKKETLARDELSKSFQEARARAKNEFCVRQQTLETKPSLSGVPSGSPLLRTSRNPGKCKTNQWGMLMFAPNLPCADVFAEPCLDGRGARKPARINDPSNLEVFPSIDAEVVKKLRSYLHVLWKDKVEKGKKDKKIYLRDVNQTFHSDDEVVGTIYMILSFYAASASIDVGLLCLAYSEFKGASVVLQTSSSVDSRCNTTSRRVFAPTTINGKIKTFLYLLEENTKNESRVFLLEQVRHSAEGGIKKLDAYIRELERLTAFPPPSPRKTQREPQTESWMPQILHFLNFPDPACRKAANAQNPKNANERGGTVIPEGSRVSNVVAHHQTKPVVAATTTMTTTTTTATATTTITATTSAEEIFQDGHFPESRNQKAALLTRFVANWQRSAVSVLIKISLERRVKSLNLQLPGKLEKDGTCRIFEPQKVEMTHLSKSSLQNYLKSKLTCAPYRATTETWLELSACEYASVVFAAVRALQDAPDRNEILCEGRLATENLLAGSIDVSEGNLWHQEPVRVKAIDPTEPVDFVARANSGPPCVYIATNQETAFRFQSEEKSLSNEGERNACFVGEAPFRLNKCVRRMFQVETLRRSPEGFETACNVTDPRTGGSTSFPFFTEIIEETSLARLFFLETRLFEQHLAISGDSFLVPFFCVTCAEGFALDDAKFVEDLKKRTGFCTKHELDCDEEGEEEEEEEGTEENENHAEEGRVGASASGSDGRQPVPIDIVRAFGNSRCAFLDLGKVEIFSEKKRPDLWPSNSVDSNATNVGTNVAPTLARGVESASAREGSKEEVRDDGSLDFVETASSVAEKLLSETLSFGETINKFSETLSVSQWLQEAANSVFAGSGPEKLSSSNSENPLTFVFPVPKNSVAVALFSARDLHSCKDNEVFRMTSRAAERPFKILGYKALASDFPLSFRLGAGEFGNDSRDRAVSGYVYVLVTQVTERVTDAFVKLEWPSEEGFLGDPQLREELEKGNFFKILKPHELSKSDVRKYVQSSYEKFIYKIHNLGKKQ